MSKAVLFLVHGIGRHKKGWSGAPDGPVAALEAAMQNYGCFAAGDKLSTYLDVVEIRYDDIFDSVLAQWSNLAASLPAAAGFDWLDGVKKVLVDCGSDRRSGISFTLPSLMSPVLPTVMPSIATCGNGRTANFMPLIDTGSPSLAEASFSIRGI